jgi:hypothetical protein
VGSRGPYDFEGSHTDFLRHLYITFLEGSTGWGKYKSCEIVLKNLVISTVFSMIGTLKIISIDNYKTFYGIIYN